MLRNWWTKSKHQFQRKNNKSEIKNEKAEIFSFLTSFLLFYYLFLLKYFLSLKLLRIYNFASIVTGLIVQFKELNCKNIFEWGHAYWIVNWSLQRVLTFKMLAQTIVNHVQKRPVTHLQKSSLLLKFFLNSLVRELKDCRSLF